MPCCKYTYENVTLTGATLSGGTWSGATLTLPFPAPWVVAYAKEFNTVAATSAHKGE